MIGRFQDHAVLLWRGVRMRKTRDTSCRFELDPKDCDWLLASLRRFGAEQTEETKDFALYLDTPEGAIGNHGLALGIHRVGEITSEDVKTAVDRAARGPSAPNGWVRCVEPLSAATPVKARRWLPSFLRHQDAQQRLRILFQIETQGSRWRVNTDRAKAEIGLVRARIMANRKQASFATVSFTCKKGPGDLFPSLTEICTPTKLRMSAEEIALRGYRFCGNLRESHITAFAPELTADMDAATTFRTIARACFDQFLLNEPAIRLTRDREAVHQCRVALRRLSTSLRIFSSLVSGAGRDELRPDLKQLAAHLHKARDLDVLIADVIAPAIGTDAPAAARNLLHTIEGRRNLAYDELVAVLSALQTAKLFSRLVGWIEAGDWMVDPEREGLRREKIASFVERKLAKATRKFKERLDELEEANQEERHHIRIRAKNLRYSGEFFETLIAPKVARKRFRAFIAALKDLQTLLGKENDVRMTRSFLASLAQEICDGRALGADKTTLAAVESLAGSIKGLSEAEFQKKAWKARRPFAEVKPFWSEISHELA
jgi:triphosphatase